MITPHNAPVLVMGGGAWGAALASVIDSHSTHEVTCLVRSPDTALALSQARLPRLGNRALPAPIKAVTDPQCLRNASAIYLVLPAAATRDACALIERYAPEGCPIILCAKGLIDAPDDTASFLPEYMSDTHPNRPFVMLSGPSFADEVIAGLPCALVAATYDDALSKPLFSHFAMGPIRLYHGRDPIGVAVGGAVKNVIALAAGIASGLGLGDNAKAALITRGLAETGRLIEALGGDKASLSGLAGIGDLTLSASGPHSRNMAYGMALGSGKAVPSALAEGARTAPYLSKRAKAIGVDMPITTAVTHALAGADLSDVIARLLARPSALE